MRYFPLTDHDRKVMLEAIGKEKQSDLFDHLPKEARDKAFFNLSKHKTEWEVEDTIERLSKQNIPASQVPSFLGAGAYRHHIPASVDYLIQRGEFLTAYTPYQPEIAQGTLQYLFEFQTQVARLTHMDVANASLYDGSTATAEAALMAMRLTKRSKILISGHVHPHYIQVVSTYGQMMGFEVITMPPILNTSGEENILASVNDSIACVITQCPGVFGHVYNYEPIIKKAHKVGALHVGVITEAVSLGLLEPPGTFGSDIVVAEGQSLGMPLSYGGPYLGLMATRDKFKRSLPGRLIGKSVDEDGRTGYIMTLVAREQHIRRAKATSNICTSAGLCSLAFTAHLSLLGGKGLYNLAVLNNERAQHLAQNLITTMPQLKILPGVFFNEITIKLPLNAEIAVKKLLKRGIFAGVEASRLYPELPEVKQYLILAATELTTNEHIETLCQTMKEVLHET